MKMYCFIIKKSNEKYIKNITFFKILKRYYNIESVKKLLFAYIIWYPTVVYVAHFPASA